MNTVQSTGTGGGHSGNKKNQLAEVNWIKILFILIEKFSIKFITLGTLLKIRNLLGEYLVKLIIIKFS